MIYPDPSSDMIRISKSGQDKNELLHLFNQNGELVKVLEASDDYLDISDLPKGIYFLRNNSDSAAETFKIYKN